MKRAALYVRVSTQEQAQEGYSVGEQRERLISYCKAHDWLIADIYVDGGYSGSNLKRPGIQKLMSETDKFDVVLVYKLDRLSRSQRDTLYLIEEIFLPNNVDFVSMQESFDTSSPFGKAMIGLLAVFAQLEREQIKERTRMGRLARAKEGLFHGGGKIPIGYDYVNGKLIVNPYEAEQIRLIFDWYLEGMSFKKIAAKMKENGYTNRHSSYKVWATIKQVIKSEIYTGRIKFGDIIVENAHEAIISKEKFKAAQALHEIRKEQYGKNSFQSHGLLTGLLICGCCGARYYRNNTISKKYQYFYYSCYSRRKINSAMIKDPNCKNKHWKAEELESVVKARVRELLMSPELAQEIAKTKRSKPVTTNNDNDKIEKRIREIDKQIGKLMDLYQVDGIPPEMLGEKINALYHEKTTLESTLTPIEEEPTDNPFDLVEALISDAAQVWDFADDSQKRRIIQSLIKRIVLTGDNVEIEWLF